jgi:hypothetical protein
MNLKVNSTPQIVKWVVVLFFIKFLPEGEAEAFISGVTKCSK